nr:LysR family transcriptional regulator [Amycolatopsis anabasis]
MLHLRYFVAVAEELNFSQAARRLHMAASPLSQRIKDLEHELGQPLFERSTHRVALTPAGAALLPLARDVLERVNAIPWKLREAVRPQRSTVFVGVPAAVHPKLRERLEALRQRCRDTFELKRWPGPSPDLTAAVRDGRLALTLARLPITDPELELMEVMTERLGAALPAERFAGRDSVRLSELADLSFISSPIYTAPASFEELDARLNSAGVKKRIRVDNADYSGIAELVSSGIAFSVTILDPEIVRRRYDREDVVVLPFEDFSPELATALVWRRDRAQPGGDLADLVGQAKDVFADPLTD